jgi:5-methylcytosine-specific restriction endonuclease McrA
MNKSKQNILKTENTTSKSFNYSKGRVSDETRRKMSEAHKGKRASEEAKKNMSIARTGKPSGMKGKKLSVETRAKMSKAHLGVKRPAEFCAKMSSVLTGIKKPYCNEEQRRNRSERQKGEKSHFWRGGVSAKNHIIRTGVEIRLWREAVFTRDNFLCQMPNCDKAERYLNAHHIKTFSKYPELRFNIKNGITLCKRCHLRIRGMEEKFENMFAEIIKQDLKDFLELLKRSAEDVEGEIIKIK